MNAGTFIRADMPRVNIALELAVILDSNAVQRHQEIFPVVGGIFALIFKPNGTDSSPYRGRAYNCRARELRSQIHPLRAVRMPTLRKLVPAFQSRRKAGLFMPIADRGRLDAHRIRHQQTLLRSTKIPSGDRQALCISIAILISSPVFCTIIFCFIAVQALATVL